MIYNQNKKKILYGSILTALGVIFSTIFRTSVGSLGILLIAAGAYIFFTGFSKKKQG